jgi:hypothetical protein
MDQIDLVASKRKAALGAETGQKERPKDDLFFDFFSMYTKTFLKEKQGAQKKADKREQMFEL